MKDNVWRIIIGVVSVLGLILVFLFQQKNLALSLGFTDKVSMFLVNRTIRFFLNDIFAIGLIYALFREKKYIIFSLWVQLAGVILILIPYFIIKVYFISYNGPMISFLHRLVLNPTLILLLIPAFFYQKKMNQRSAKGL